MKTGRNDPCPCGSGKKYKKCCANKSASSILQDMKEDIHNLIGGRSFGSIEEVQDVLDQYQQQKNEKNNRNYEQDESPAHQRNRCDPCSTCIRE